MKLMNVFFTLIFFSSSGFASNLNLKLANPYSVATIDTYETLCEEQGISPAGSSLNDMCEIVVKSEVCQSVDEEDLLNCQKLDNSLIANNWDLIVGCSKGVFNSVKDTLSFFWEMMKFAWENTTSSKARGETAEAASEMMKASKLYLQTEYHKALAKASPPFKEVKAVAGMSSAIGSLIMNKITEFVSQEYKEFGCLNHQAKNEHMCKLIGDIILPPVGVVALLKYGKGAIHSYPHLSKVFESPDVNRIAFQNSLKNYPMLKKTYKNIGKKIEVSPQISHPREIPFEESKGFRQNVTSEEMVRRANELPPEISDSVVAVYNSLNDPKLIKSYYQDLFKDTVERMVEKGRPEDLELLNKGQISLQALNVVIVKRMKDKGDNQFTTFRAEGFDTVLKHKKGTIDPQDLETKGSAFRTAVRNGPFVDRVFDDKDAYSHGAFTHIIQRDIVTESLKRTTNGNNQMFWDFLGTKKGINWWVDLFDSGSSKGKTSPENLRRTLTTDLNAY